MLNSSKAYVQHKKGPSVQSRESLDTLSRPRLAGAHPDVAIGITDPVTFAQWKTEQLAIKRMASERQQQELGREQQAAQAALQGVRLQRKQVCSACVWGQKGVAW